MQIKDLNKFETKNFPWGEKIQISAAPIRCMDSSSMTENHVRKYTFEEFLSDYNKVLIIFTRVCFC